MKQETRDKIKKYGKYARIFVEYLIWLLALVGVSAFAIYWCRANADYEQSEASPRVIARYNANNTDGNYYFTLNNPLSYIESLPNSVASAESKDIGFYFTNNSSSEDYYVYFGFTDTDDTLIYNGSSRYDIVRVRIRYINYQFGVYLVQLGYDWSNWINLYSSDNGYSSAITLRTSKPINLDYIYQNNDSATYHEFKDNAMFDYLFSEVYTEPFYFTENYNFSRLTSEVVTSERLIPPYNGVYNGVPGDEIIYFYVSVPFFSNNTYYVGIYFDLVQPIYVYKDSVLQVNTRGNMSQLMIRSVYYCSTACPSNGSDAYYTWVNTPSNKTLVCSKHIRNYETYNTGVSDVQAPVYDYQQYDWVSDVYQTCYFNENNLYDTYSYVLYPTDNTMWSNRLYYGLTLNDVLKNGYTDYEYARASDTVSVDDIGLGQVFDLYKVAFSGLIPIFNIQVIPGITLGLLIFLPIVATVIIVVLRLVKK